MNTIGNARLGSAIGVGTSVTRARGTVTFTGTPAGSDFLVPNGRTYEYVGAGPFFSDDLELPAFVPALSGTEAYAAQFAGAINSGTYGGSANSDVYATRAGSVVTLWSRVSGPSGNSITLAKSSAAITISGATLTGG